MAAAIAVAIATTIDHSAKLSPGEVGYVLVVAGAKDQAARVFDYCRAFLEESPILRQLVESVTADEIRLKGNIAIAVHANNFRTIRGRTLLSAVLDECAFWHDAGALPDIEVYRAILPALITTRGMLIAISSPYRKIGLLHQKHRDHFGTDDDDVLVIQGSSREFNPMLDESEIQRNRKLDPTGSAAEWDANFRADISQLYDDETIDAAIDEDRPLEFPPREGLRYFAFVDASAGRHDAFTICIGHREGEGDQARFISDVIRGRRAPFNPSAVTEEYTGLAREYRCATIVGDNYAGEWVKQAFEKAGRPYVRSSLPKSGLYLESLPWFMRGAMSFPNIPHLVRELRLLERTPTRSGKDKVDHPARGGSDDFANALVGCAYEAMTSFRANRIQSFAGPRVFVGSILWNPPEQDSPSGPRVIGNDGWDQDTSNDGFRRL